MRGREGGRGGGGVGGRGGGGVGGVVSFDQTLDRFVRGNLVLGTGNLFMKATTR